MVLRRRTTAVLVALLALAQPYRAGAQNGREPILGPWVGVYQSYPQFVRMTLQIAAAPSSPGRFSGELRLEPLVQVRTIGRAPAGVVNVSVDYDAAAATVRIAPAADAYRALGLQLPQFAGVVDEERHMIGGTLVPVSMSASPYFVMARPDAAESFLKPLRDVGAGPARPAPAGRPQPAPGTTRPGSPPGPVAVPSRTSGGAISEDKLREWATRFTTEYPTVDPYRTESGAVGLMTRNLFRDDFFRPYFNRSFDELDPAHMTEISMVLRKIPPPRSNFPEEKVNGVLRSVDRAFIPSGTYSSPDIMLSVIALRPIQRWVTASLQRLGSPAPTLEGLQTVARIEGAEDVAIRTLWPSEQRTFAEAVSGAKAKIAGPVLTQRVDELLASTKTIAGAQPIMTALDQSKQRLATTPTTTAVPAGRGVPGRPSPVAHPPAAGRGAAVAPAIDSSLPALMAMVPADVRQAQTARLEARLAEIVDAEAQKDGQSLGRLGDGAAGLEAGGKWLAEVNRKYGSLARRPAVSALVDDLAKRRVAQFRAGESTVTTRLQAVKTSLDVNAVIGTYLSVPSDRSDPIGGRLLSSALQKRDQLQTAEAEAAQREARAQREAASPCAKGGTQRDHEDEPTEREMCYAIERTLTGAQAVTGELAAACNDVRPNGDPMTAMTCLMGKMGQVGGGPQFSVRAFRKIACASAAAVARPGYFCDYAIQVVTGNAMTAGLINRLPGEVSTARFVRSSGTWLFFPTRRD
jgi:hypothetical protein